jgi:NRPS condensation-like uncharacterized protein
MGTGDFPNVILRDPVDAPQRIDATPADLSVQSWQGRSEMVIEMECSFDGHLEEDVLARAGEFLLEAEPILGCRLVVDPEAPYWQRVPTSQRTVLTVAREFDEYERARRSGLDATRGVQVALCLWPRDRGDRLLVKMTHVVGDGVALQLVAARLSSLYSALSRDPDYRPSASRVRTRHISQIFSAVPKLAYARIIWDFAWFIAPRLRPRRTHAIPLPQESVGPWVPVIRRVPAARSSFLSRYGKERGATLNDMFLAAAYRALAFAYRWDGTSALRITITVDLRRWCLPPTHAATICNLSSFDFPFLIRDLGRSFDETLANVSALMRRRKKSRPGLAPALVGHLYATSRVAKSAWNRGRKSGTALSLSNEGPLDASSLRFADETPVAAHILPPFIELPAVHICLSGYAGTLTLAAVTPSNGQELVGRFLDAMLEELPREEPGRSSAGINPDLLAPGSRAHAHERQA